MMLLFSPLLLLGDITGLLWLVGIVLVVAFLAILVGVVLVGRATFVADAPSESAKSKRKTILAVVAPILAFIILWHLLSGLF
ncbi:hypothetical protein [Hymenobacter properus]|uniref:Uncharacterized protein n=1 Tax=Hymenobacter properus TaxID=2791026 RepID=A0A931FQ42_9BACT|nr:hypothetical protein [Hymenobacter properus]MBF9144224.1 hypothetical protein [Hymenobacter properus]MBR7723042.1 hypothetical protein [Microvirga sp. SRT04]